MPFPKEILDAYTAYLASHPSQQRIAQNVALTAADTIPDWLRNKVVNPAIGRVVTNLVPPLTYGDKVEVVKKQIMDNPMKAAMSVYQDTPNFINNGTDQSSRFQQEQAMRQVLWRKYWGMNPKDSNQFFNQQGNNFAFNPANERSAQVIRQLNNLSYSEGSLQSGPVVGQFITGQPDRWDFNLHPNEIPQSDQPYDKVPFLREIAERLSGTRNAPVVQTKYP